MRRVRGFTLLEVLVTLAVFAMVAAGVLNASARNLQNASWLEDKVLAMWIADNRLNELQLEQMPPSSGRNQGGLKFTGHRWEWHIQVDSTAEQDMRRVIVWVAAKPLDRERGSIKERAAAHLVGFLGNQPWGYSGASPYSNYWSPSPSSPCRSWPPATCSIA